MKKLLSVIALLLLCALVLPSCAASLLAGDSSSTENSTTTPGSGNEDSTTTPGSGDSSTDNPATMSDGIYGIWHSDDIGAVLEIKKENNTINFYSLSTGYYEYYSLQSGTYKIVNNVLIFTLGDSSNSFVCAYDTLEDTVTVGEVTYKRTTKLPEKHPSYSFPDFLTLINNFDYSSVISLPDYKSIKITDIAMEEARMAIFKSFYSSSLSDCPTITDRPAQRGDFVVVDYVGYKNGETFQGGSANDAEISIIYNSGYIPGFAEGIIGHSVGESFDVNVTFPEDYSSAALAGQKVVFRMHLTAIYDVRLSQEQFDKFENLEYDTYEEYVTEYARMLSGDLAWTMLIEDSKLIGELPEEAYLYFYQDSLDYMHYIADMYGIEYQELLDYYGYTEEYFMTEAKIMAVGYLIPYLIAKAESLSFTSEQYDELMDEFVESYRESYPESTVEEAKEQILKTQGKYFEATLMGEIVVDWLANVLFVTE